MDLAPCGAFHAPYDTAGRLSADTVTSLGPASDPTRAVDGSVLQIATAYDDMGRVATVTSYADVAGTSPVNQVEYVYNGWGTVDSEYQEPNGLVGPISSTTSVYVQYDYDDGSYTDPKGATAASYLRLDLVWYPANPNGGGSNFVNYLYRLDPSDGTIDNMMSRVDDIETTGVNDLMFRYLGASTLATEDLADLDIELDYSAPSSTSTATNFGTWDRFGRVRDQLWASYGSEWSAFGPANADPDHFTYTYDREGNVTSEASPQNTNFSQTYTYDALNRLTSSTRGDGLANQTWGLDGVGNMATVTMTSSTPQSRTVNAANEIAASSGIVTPLYDAAGNTIYGPSALQGQQATPVHCVYDAWNRLVAVYADNGSGGLGAEIAGYQYDGLNRRVKKSLFDSSGNPTGGDQYYYNQNGQVIEDDSVDTNGVAQSIDQYVWGPGSAGAPLVCLHDGNADGDPTNDDYYTDWRRYYLTDANGNVTTMIRFGADPVFGSDEIAYVTRVVYTAYGTATEMGEDWTGAGVEYAFDGPLYCGYWHDTETGLSQTQNRYYNPNLSTWINRDPIGYQGGTDLYTYCGDDAPNSTDPTGLVTMSLVHATTPTNAVGIVDNGLQAGADGLRWLATPDAAGSGASADATVQLTFKLNVEDAREIPANILREAEKTAYRTTAAQTFTEAGSRNRFWARTKWDQVAEWISRQEGGAWVANNPKGAGKLYALKSSAWTRSGAELVSLSGEGAESAVASLAGSAGKAEGIVEAAQTAGSWGSRLKVAGKIGGRALIVVGVGVSVYDIYSAKDKTRQAVIEVSGWGGAWAGASAGTWAGGGTGAWIGAWIGGIGTAPVGGEGAVPGAGVGAAIGGVIGGIGGGIGGFFGGRKVAQTAYDWAFTPGVSDPTVTAAAK